jgi:site-specific DNA-methyltransferase (adenine-specific)
MYKIIIGDCLLKLKEISNNYIDMILTDLPYYGVVDSQWDNQWKNEEDFLEWIHKIIVEFDRVLKDNTNLFLFTGRKYNRHINLILDKYFIEKRTIIWTRKRNRTTTFGNSLSSGYEPISYYSKGNGVFNKIKVMPQRKDLRERYEKHPYLNKGILLSDVWGDISALPHNSKEKLNHQSQKPLKLIKRIIELGSKENDVILDATAGVLTTLNACTELNRQCICIEKNKDYVNDAIKSIPFLKFNKIQIER